jgi:hypothetical protein
MKYRIHDLQTIGFKPGKSIKSITGFAHIHLAVTQAKFVWDNYEEFMNDETKGEFSLFIKAITAPAMSFKRWNYFVFSHRRFRGSFAGQYLFVIKLLLIRVSKN